MRKSDVLIVGGGHAGAQAAIVLRQKGFLGTVTIVGQEDDLPYHRPPLSKEYLIGEKQFYQIYLRPPAFWQEQGINMVLGCRIESVHPQGRFVIGDDGTQFHYGSLVWAAGGAPRQLSCAGRDLKGVYSVRSRLDVERLDYGLQAAARVVVIGAGYIGLEVAAALVKRGKSVTVLEAQGRVLARVAGPTISRYFERKHRAEGVVVRLNETVTSILGKNGLVEGIALQSGKIIPADLVVVGIGIVPSVEPLLRAGAGGDNGVNVDEYCRTSLPRIFAIGDCAAHVNAFANDARVRIESVQNANDQAAVVADNLTGGSIPYGTVPWFWSTQYDVRLQTAGLSAGYDQEIIRGDETSLAFSVVYLRDGKVIALDCINASKDYMQGRALVLNQVSPDLVQLANSAVSLKELAPGSLPAT